MSNATVTRSATCGTYSVRILPLKLTRSVSSLTLGSTQADGSRPRRFFHQHGGADARDASADTTQVRTSGPGAAYANDRQHAAVLTRGARTAEVDQAARGRWRDQPGRRAAPVVDCRGGAAAAAADARRGTGRARHSSAGGAGTRRIEPDAGI